MRGRGSSAVSDDIELLDVERTPAVAVEHVDVATKNRWGAAAAVALTVLAVGLVAGIGNTPAPVEPPDVTIEEEPSETEPPITERQQLEDQYGVAIGDGPGLEWQSIDTKAATRAWQWAGDRFVADNGTTEWSVGLVDAGLDVTRRDSLLLEYPGYRITGINGGQLLIPSDAVPDHLVIVRGDARARVPLPRSDWPASDLFVTNTWVNGATINNRLVTQVSTWSSIDVDELRARTGDELVDIAHARVVNGGIQTYSRTLGSLPDPISFEDAALTEAEVAAAESLNGDTNDVFTIDLTTLEIEPVDFADLRYIDEFVESPAGELLIGWTDTGELRWHSSSADGIEWSTTRSTTNRFTVSSGTQLFDLSARFTIDRSSDGGRTWDSTADPLRNRQRTFAGDVVAVGRPWDGYGIDTGVTVETGTDFWLTLFDRGQRFELRGIRTFETPLLEGWIDDPTSGAAWDWSTNELVFTDQRTGRELLRLSEHAVDVASAEAKPMETIALTRWSADVADPEWLITSPTDVFGPEALAVDFVGGHEQLLAIVTTIDGYEVYLADTASRS